MVSDAGGYRGFRAYRLLDTVYFEIQKQPPGVYGVRFPIHLSDEGQWIHLVGISDNGTLKIYRNGGLAQDRVVPLGDNGQRPFAIGFDSNITDFFWLGKIDDVRLYGGPLTDTEIQTLFHEGGYLTNQYPVLNSWNMLSVPLTVSDARKSILFPTATSRAFAYTPSGYVPSDTLQNGPGYWLKFPSAQDVGISGTLRMLDTIAVTAGWNMIGTISDSVRVATIQQIPPTIVASQFYGYNGGYSVDTVLFPSRGYWVKTISPGLLVLSSASSLNKVVLSAAFDIDKAGTITLSDLLGSKQTLGVSSEQLEQKDLDYYELPPPPPAGVFDARFSTNRVLEAVKEGESKTIPIQVSYAQYPLTISWEMKDQSLTASMMIGTREVPTNGTGSIAVTDSKAQISLKIGGQSTLPKEFGLAQNYPNPFNPSTTIKYDLPRESHVSLKLFNVLGQEVATLVSEEQKVGCKSVVWNASNFASGVYFYRLQAGDFIAIKKLLMLR